MTGVTPSETQTSHKFSILLPNMEEHILNQQCRQQQQHAKSYVKLCELSPHDSVNVQNTRGGMEKWVPGTVIRQLGSLTYLVRVGHQLCYAHIDHLLQIEYVNCEEAFEQVVTEESSVPVLGSSTPPPPLSVTVSKTTQDQPAETQKPVQQQSETSPRNMPVKAEPRFPARERKAPDRLDLWL